MKYNCNIYFTLLVFWYWCCCIFSRNMFLFYILIIQERKVLQAAVRFHLMQFCHSAECCQVFQTSISFLSVFLLFSSMEPRFFKQQYVFILCVLILSRIFYQQIKSDYFVCFCHLTEWQANMFFLFVFMSFSKMEPRLFKQQYFLKFDFYHIKKLNFFKKWVFEFFEFCVFAIQ